MSRKTTNTSGTQPATKRVRTSSSTPTFRTSRARQSVKGATRHITIRQNAHGRRGHITEARRPMANEEPSDEPTMLPPPDLGAFAFDHGELSHDPETSVPTEPLKPKRKQRNTTSVSLTLFLFI